MQPERHERHAIIKVSVVGHVHYGLTIRSEQGEPGYVDCMYVVDGLCRPSEWPVVGTQIEIVVHGYTNDSRRGYVDRIRGDARPSSLAEVRSQGKPDAPDAALFHDD